MDVYIDAVGVHSVTSNIQSYADFNNSFWWFHNIGWNFTMALPADDDDIGVKIN